MKSNNYFINYRKLTAACQTNAKSINKTGIIGNTSTRGSNAAYASGNFASSIFIKIVFFYFMNFSIK